MKINKLYIRNFLMVMAIIIAAQVCIAGLFRIVGSIAGKKNYQSELKCIAYLISDSVSHRTDVSDQEGLSSLLADISKAWSADIWLEDLSGKVIASSTRESRPVFPPDMEYLGSYGISREKGGPPTSFLIISLEGNKTVFIRQIHKNIFFDEIYFMAGLLIITMIVALILFPVSKKITIPLNRLTESANAISRGEFDLSVDETSYYEIAELAKAFNRMSGCVLQMINGTKELTANISHQIRSPLARISVAAELIRDNISAGDISGIENKLSFIEKEINDIDALTGRIIELIRVDIAHKTFEYEKIDLKKIASDTVMKFTDMIRKKEITSTMLNTAESGTIQGIPRDIYELFDILYDNAVRYSTSKGFINTEFCSNNDNIFISLSNSSMPLTDEVLSGIFEPFTRNAPEKIPGHGLGLAIARRIVKNHGGNINVEYGDNIFTILLSFSLSQSVS